jgi:outer membrane protein OmpA-like peptidoglycan-associated protein
MSQVPRATLDMYHCILDIVGHRMREAPAAKLTITGLEAGVDRAASRGLPTRRAQGVRDYLIYAWRIDPSRISVTDRVEPLTSYGMTQEQVVQEARRVELSSTDPRILDPIVRIDTVHTLRPPRAVFLPGIHADAGLRDWELTVSNETGLTKHWAGGSLIPDSISWDWHGSDGNTPTGAGKLKFQLRASDIRGETRESEAGYIPVRSITLEQKVLQRLPDRTLETVSLILFDLDKATLSDRHREMLANTMLHVETGSTLLIRGYTDALGETEYNFALAGRRAEAVRGVFAKSVPSSSMRVESMGESLLLYPNDLPEGRFYCRTVQVSIETLVQR